MSIAISGDLGSGKSSIAHALAQRLGFKLLSTGAIQRELARSMGVSTLDVNRRAESDPSIDAAIDSTLMSIDPYDTGLVIDSRMAWHFVRGVLSVHLVVEPATGAARVLGRDATVVEAYESQESALAAIESRRESERARFKVKYSVDIGRLSNYDLVLDTTSESVSSLCDRICDAHAQPDLADGRVYLDPMRILPGVDWVHDLTSAELAETAPPRVIMSGDFVFAIQGLRAVSDALRGGRSLIRVVVVREADDTIVPGLRAGEFGSREVRPGWVYSWEAAHGFRFQSLPGFERG